jgi:hypothetical protein
MTTIISFDRSRCRPANKKHPIPKSDDGPAQILIFTGVRREPLVSAEHAPRRPEPMFDSPAPGKPGGRKQRRS